MNRIIAPVIAAVFVLAGLITAGPASAAVDNLGGHVTARTVITEQTCYRTVRTTYRRYAGRYWVPVHTATRWHPTRCGFARFWNQQI